MKKRMKQLMAVMLSVALCVPAIPGAYGYAATSGTTFTQEEEIALSGLGSERSTLFNDGWKFSLSDPSGAESTSFNDGSWDAVTLPHDFSISQNFTTSGEAESGFLPGGTGWYRKSFTVPSGCDGKSVILSFDGVYQNAYVYVNGKQVGENHYGYTSFAFDISKYLVCDCSRSKFLSKLLKTFDKTFREIFPVFISTKRREKPSAFFDNNFVNNAYFSEAASSSSSHLASSSSKAPISSRMTCLCLWSS